MEFLNKKNNLRFKTTIVLIITTIIIYFLFRNARLDLIYENIVKMDKYYLILSVFTLLIGYLLFIQRWYCILKYISGEKIEYKKAVNSFMAGLSLNSILPSKLGDFYKIFYFSNIGKLKTSGMVLAERLIDLFVLALLLLLGALVVNNKTFINAGIIGIILVVTSMVGLYLLKEKIKNSFFQKISFSLIWLSKNTLSTLKLILLTFIGWIVSLTQIYFLFLALHLEMNYFNFIAISIIIVFVGMLPITISGMGTRDAAILILLANLGSKETLLAFGLLITFFRYWFSALMGLPFLLKSKNLT